MRRFRFGFLVSLLLLSALGFAQDTRKKITFDEPAGPADRVLNDLTKVAGIKLSANLTMAKEILIISVQDVPLFELTKRIAAVTSGEWIQQDDGYVLEPNSGLRASQDQAFADEKVAAIRSELDGLRKKLEDKDTDTDTQTTAVAGVLPNPFMSGLAKANLIDKLLVQLDPTTLAGVSPHERAVFASSPTPMQIQLPSIDPDDLTALINQHNKTAEAIQQTPQVGDDAAVSQAFDSSIFQQYFKPISGTPAKVLLIVSNSAGIFTKRSADMRLYDANGKVLYTERDQLFGSQSGLFAAAMEMAETDKKPEAAPPEEKGVPIAFNDTDKLFLKLSTMGRGATVPQLPPELKAILLDPATYEPLSLVVSSATKALAQEKGEQFVGDLPDSLMDGLVMGGQRFHVGMTTGQVRTILKMGDSVDMMEASGWLQITPKHPSDARANRFDRELLAALLQDTAKRGSPSLDDMSAYALASDEPEMTSLAGFYILVGVPGAMSRLILGGGEDWQTLRFYGSLRSDQRDALRNGQSINPMTMTPDQIEYVREMAFGDKSGLKFSASGPKKEESFLTKIMMQGMGMFMPAQETSWLEEPTECMPQGLPNNLSIGETLESGTTVKLAGNSDLMSNLVGDMGADEYASLKYMLTQIPTQGAMPNFAKLLVGTRLTYHLRFQLLPKVFMERDLIDDSFPADGAPVSPDELPAEFKDKANSITDQLKKQPSIFGAPVPATGG